MNNFFKTLLSIVFLLYLFFTSACAVFPGRPTTSRPLAYTVESDGTLLSRLAPVFVVENPEAPYNRIGLPKAGLNADGLERIYVAPDPAAVYAEARRFTTAGGRYINLVYRVHFSEVPGGLVPFYLGKGQNVGLLVVVTLNARQQPLLYTLVHTCGCYLAFVPTSYMSESGYPEGWKKGRQAVYSEDLPGFLDYRNADSEQAKTIILIRSGTHRVKDMWLSDAGVHFAHRQAVAHIQPLAALENLSLGEGAFTSFYETAGSRKGYVKGSQKIRERLLMSWWALDWRVGEDKKCGKDRTDGIVFYTSLKPWAREASDMRDFSAFLGYWGWRL